VLLSTYNSLVKLFADVKHLPIYMGCWQTQALLVAKELKVWHTWKI